MTDKSNSTYKGFTKARKEANERYMSKFVEIKVRMTPKKRELVQEHAAKQSESTTKFINRAIDETMKRDTSNPSPDKEE